MHAGKEEISKSNYSTTFGETRIYELLAYDDFIIHCCHDGLTKAAFF